MRKKTGGKFVTRVRMIVESVSKSRCHGSEGGCANKGIPFEIHMCTYVGARQYVKELYVTFTSACLVWTFTYEAPVEYMEVVAKRYLIFCNYQHQVS